MKTLEHIFVGRLMLMVSACGNQGTDSESTQQGKDSESTLQGKDSMVIISVNTDNDVGYFVDSEGNKLFNKQFERVSNFSEGLAYVKQNDKWGFINTQGEVVAPCIYDYAGFL